MIVAYKAFDKDLSCTSGGNTYRYKLNEWNTEPEANCRQNGFHCAANPLDCLSYYSNWNNAVYYMVLADGDINEDGNDSKIACTRIKLVKHLSLEQFIAESMLYISKYPMMENNRYVKTDKGKASGGFTIVRGKNPMAQGSTGDILGLVKEELDRQDISEIGLHIVDGKNFMPDIWYKTEGTKAERQVGEE